MIKTIFKNFFELFNKHPSDVGMNYFSHMLLSLKFSIMLFIASIKAFLHALFPFMFETSTSDVVAKINKRLNSNCKKKEKDKSTYNFAV
tara:strand:- start:6814 stop:7080 length:267 start_codon:yes stop_codon:yes gene_type:complete